MTMFTQRDAYVLRIGLSWMHDALNGRTDTEIRGTLHAAGVTSEEVEKLSRKTTEMEP